MEHHDPLSHCGLLCTKGYSWFWVSPHLYIERVKSAAVVPLLLFLGVNPHKGLGENVGHRVRGCELLLTLWR